MLRLSVRQLIHVGVKEVSEDALHPAGLEAPDSGDQRWIESQVQDLCGVESNRAGLGRVEPLDGAGQPDESLQTLDVFAAVVHQLVFSHSSTAAGRKRGNVCQPQSHFQRSIPLSNTSSLIYL